MVISSCSFTNHNHSWKISLTRPLIHPFCHFLSIIFIIILKCDYWIWEQKCKATFLNRLFATLSRPALQTNQTSISRKENQEDFQRERERERDEWSREGGVCNGSVRLHSVMVGEAFAPARLHRESLGSWSKSVLNTVFS